MQLLSGGQLAMEPLMRLVVPDMDGGLFRPLFHTVANNMGNFTQTNFDFQFAYKGGDSLPLIAGNETDAVSVWLNSSHALNVSHVDMGRPLLLWYLGRLSSQVPLFVTASLLWLILLVCLLWVYLHLRRLRAADAARGGRRSPGPVTNQRKLKPLFGLFTTILLLTVVGCVLYILHWSGRAQFLGMSEGDRNASQNESSATSGPSHLTATFRRTVDEFDRVIELSIVDTNVTVLNVCKDELPNVLNVLETVAKFLLDRLAADFKLAPLLNSFDVFIELIKLLVDSMRVIKDSRAAVVTPLAEFTTLVDSVRRDLAEQASDACREAWPAGPPADLCARIRDGLDLLAVGVNHRQLDSDSSVTIVTLLEKMLKLNFTQVEGQVDSAKGQLYGSLNLVKAEVTKLFDHLVVAVSGQFENALVDAEFFRSNLRGAKRDAGFLDAMETIDRTVLGLSVSLALGSFTFLAILLLALFVSLRYLLSFRDTGEQGGTVGDGTDEVDLAFLAPGVTGGVDKKWSRHSNGKAFNGFDLNSDAVALPSRRHSASEPRDWHSTCLLVSCLLVLAALLYASAVFYAGAEAHMDACRYLTTESGVAKVDQFVNSLIQEKLWPQIESLLDRQVKIPLGITGDQMPSRLLGPVLDACRNESATIFQALELRNLVNFSQLLRTPFVLGELQQGSRMIEDMVRDLNTSNLIPAEVDDLLQKTLPSFAAVIDAEDFASSIRELRKPLLLIGPRLPSLRGDLGQLETWLIKRNSTDRRAVLIRHFSDRASSLIAEWNSTLNSGLGNLLAHYTALQTNRRLTNLTLALTADAVALKVALSDKRLLVGAIRTRYNQTLERHLPTVASLLTGILHRLQDSVGRCRPLRDVFQIPVGWCSSRISPLPSTGLYMMASCLAFYLLVQLFLALMFLMRRR